jgi:hypothetical protein
MTRRMTMPKMCAKNILASFPQKTRDFVLVQKEPPCVVGRLSVSRFGLRVYFTLTVAVSTTKKSLIIRTARTTTIRERQNNCVDIGFGYFARL